jgi:hypothetical protein
LLINRPCTNGLDRLIEELLTANCMLDLLTV